MPHRNQTSLFAFTLLLAIALPCRAGDSPLPAEGQPWLDARTAHFRFTSELPEQETKRLALGFETLRAVMRYVRPDVKEQKMKVEAEDPFDIFIFLNGKSFAPFSPGKGYAGFFLEGPGGYKIAFDSSEENPTQIVYHEMIHYMLHKTYRTLPTWLDEGLAQYYSTLVVQNNQALLGRPDPLWILGLKVRRTLQVQQLLDLGFEKPGAPHSVAVDQFYPTSWLLVHFFLGTTPERHAQFSEFLSLLQSGTPHMEAFRKAVPQSTAELDKELNKYLSWLAKTRKFQYWPVDFTRLEVPDRFSARPLAYPTVLGRLALLAQEAPNRSGLTAQLIEASLSRDPRCPPALLAKGLDLVRSEKATEGVALISAAMEGETDPWVLNNTAENLMAADKTTVLSSGTPLSPLLAQARALFRRVIQLNLEDQKPLFRFTELSITSREDLLEALGLIETAIPKFADQFGLFEKRWRLTVQLLGPDAGLKVIESAEASPNPTAKAWAAQTRAIHERLNSTRQRHQTLQPPPPPPSSPEPPPTTTPQPPGGGVKAIATPPPDAQDSLLDSALSELPATPQSESIKASFREAHRLFKNKATRDALTILASLAQAHADPTVKTAISQYQTAWTAEIRAWTIKTYNDAVTQANVQNKSGAVKLMEQVARLAIDPTIKEKAKALVEKWKSPPAKR